MAKEKKFPIGILDGGFEGINIFNELTKAYPYETFIYVSDHINYPYEGLEEKVISRCVEKNIKKLLSYNVSMIIVVNNSIIEYCSEYLKTLLIPVLKINDVLIDYVNENYEHKNMILLAKQYTIKSYIYQKNIRYNHLYSVQSDEMEKLIFNKETKTSKSFKVTKELLGLLRSKDIDVVIVADSYLSNLRIEMNEYVVANEIINLSSLMVSEVEKFLNKDVKSRRRSRIITGYKKKEFKNIVYWLDCKYKYVWDKDGKDTTITRGY